MALRQVEYIAPTPNVIERKAKKGGGGFGSAIGAGIGGALGGLAAAGATVATGGAAAPAIGVGIAGGAAAGAGLGGMIGNAVSPARAASSSVDRRVEATQPQLIQSEQTQKLKDSLIALQGQPEELRQQYGQPLVAAYLKSYQSDMGVA